MFVNEGLICIGKRLGPCTFVQIIEESSLFSRPRPAFFNATDRKVNGCLMMRKSVIQELGLRHPAYYASIILNVMIVSGLVQITSMNVFEQKLIWGANALQYYIHRHTHTHNVSLVMYSNVLCQCIFSQVRLLLLWFLALVHMHPGKIFVCVCVCVAGKHERAPH